ncbi:MAG: hypothetical protein MUC49_15125 [Raineya sp.]|jgi:hypothetical protein|nr:hypothetical protein [Raineya sp.]
MHVNLTKEEAVYLKEEIYCQLKKSMKEEDKVTKLIEDYRNDKTWLKLLHEELSDVHEEMNFLHTLYGKLEKCQ